MSKDDIYKFFFKKFKKKLKRGVPNQGNSSIKTIIDLTSFSRILRNLTKKRDFVILQIYASNSNPPNFLQHRELFALYHNIF